MKELMIFKVIIYLVVIFWIALIVTIVLVPKNYDREISYPQYPVKAYAGNETFTIIDEGEPDNVWTIKFPEGPPPHEGMYLGWVCDDVDCNEQH